MQVLFYDDRVNEFLLCGMSVIASGFVRGGLVVLVWSVLLKIVGFF